jgi:type IV pilus assembly protein PilF
MQREIVLLLAVLVLASGCRTMDRLSFIRPSAARGEFRQVAPSRDVSGKPGKQSADPVLMLQTAGDAYRLGDLVRADALATAALKHGADVGDANTLLGVIADARDQPARAGEHYRAAVAANPGQGLFANNYGTWLCANGRADESLAWFDRAVTDPNYPTPASALTNAGACARKAGQPIRAEANWRLALAAQPLNPEALAGLAALEADRGHNMEARAFVERWLELAPNDPDALQLAIRIEEARSDNQAAARYRNRLQQTSPTMQTQSPTP